MAALSVGLLRRGVMGAPETQQDVKRTATSVGNLGDAASQADADAERLGDSVRQTADDVASLGAQSEDTASGMADAFAVAAGAIASLSLGDAISQAMAVDASEDLLAAQIGVTGKMAKDAGDLVGKLFRDGYDRGLALDTVRSLDVNLDVKAGRDGTEVFAERLMDLQTTSTAAADDNTKTL